MPLASGTRLGPYEIVSALGAGGMGEVYRARDQRLERTVAIKVLPPEVASDPDLRQRLEREARAISKLSHPHICAFYDIGQQDGTCYLVMECLEGLTLAQRLASGPLPLAEALRIAAEIADALDWAHRHGITHRDLKPGNVVLTRHGAKLLDFGLAKPTGGFFSAAETGSLPARRDITAHGVVVGTVPYMSPEQLEGKPVDGRSDIFSLGSVLYELVTGKRAFSGDSAASLAAAIIATDPPLASMLAPATPAKLDRILQACLKKNPDERWQSAHDLKLELKWLAETATEAAAPAVGQRRPQEKLAWAAVAVLAVLAVVLGWLYFQRSVAPAQIVRSSLLPPPKTSFVANHFAVSPDGRRLAFVAVAEDGRTNLWVRSLNSATAQPLAGTEGATSPFWSPDNSSIGFFADGKLKTVEVSGGAVRMLCEAPNGRGGTWSRDGTIVFAPFTVGPLQRVSASGGAPVVVTKLAREGSGQAHRWPSFLPDGRHFLYFVDWSAPADPQGNGIYVASLDSPEAKLISADIIGNVEYASGHLVFVHNRSLVAQPFDSERLVFTGPPKPLAEQEVQREAAFSHASFSTSANGVTMFESAADVASELVWLDSSGKEIGRIPGRGYKDPRLSPDGRYLAVSYDPEHNGIYSIHVYDLMRGTMTRLTEGRGEEFPLWSADSKKIFYLASSGQTSYLNEIAADGSGTPRVLLQGAKMIPNGTSPDGRYLVYMDFEKGFPFLGMYSTADGSHRPVPQAGVEAQISPNGRLIAHLGPGGRPVLDVFVRPFPDPGPRIQISTNGGAQPRWRGDSRQLYYIAPDKKLMAVDFDPTGERRASAPRPLFQTRIVLPSFALLQYDVTPDGKRFIVNSLPPAGTVPLTLLTGWGERKN